MLCDNTEGWNVVESGREVRGEGTYVYLELIYTVVQKNPAQHCKAIILQIKMNKTGKT